MDGTACWRLCRFPAPKCVGDRHEGIGPVAPGRRSGRCGLGPKDGPVRVGPTHVPPLTRPAGSCHAVRLMQCAP